MHSVLTIAGVRLNIRSELALVSEGPACYSPFLGAPAQETSFGSTVDVEVLATPCPGNDSPILFEAAGAWSLQSEGEGYRLSFGRSGSGRVRTIAVSDAATTRVRVYLNQDLEPASPPADSILDPVRYPLDQPLLMYHLAGRGGIIVHAAGVVIEGQAVVLPGVSGAGKSTLSRLLLDAGPGESLLSDDRVILRSTPGSPGGKGPETFPAESAATPRAAAAEPLGAFKAWGTPWPGDAQVARNASAPLAALLFLVKAAKTEAVPLAPGEAMRRLMPVVSCPWYDKERGSQVLETCGRVVETVPCYDLRFRPDHSVADLLMSGAWAPAT